jgi:hypothetical protein
LQDDVASTAFWYEQGTASPPSATLEADLLEVI